MDKLIALFPEQLAQALEIGSSYLFKQDKIAVKHVVITGLGGSGIGGSLVQNYLSGRIKIPLFVNKNYFLPAFVDETTLVIVSSYSGDTEETIEALNEAVTKKARVICITSGGKIAEIARAANLDCIIIPPGMPPRACLGYSFVQLLYILAHYEVSDRSFESEISEAAQLLRQDSSLIQTESAALAKKMVGVTPVIYVENSMEAVAVRWRQQINENAKTLCWHNVIPEMNHNELVGWKTNTENRAVIFLRNDNDYERVQMRIEINKTIIRQYTNNITEVYSKGGSYLARALYLVHYGDWLSWFLAQENDLDATEVAVIDFLKGELAKQPGN